MLNDNGDRQLSTKFNSDVTLPNDCFITIDIGLKSRVCLDTPPRYIYALTSTLENERRCLPTQQQHRNLSQDLAIYCYGTFRVRLPGY